MEPGKCARTAISKKENMVRSPACKFNHFARKSVKQSCLNSQLKPPKCYIKITGSRYNGSFLLNIDSGLDDAIYHTMREIELALEAQTDPMRKPSVSPKNCLSSVFRCFGNNELQTQTVCGKKKPPKPVDKPAECALTATVNKSDLGPLISAVQSKSFITTPENSSERVMREVVDVFRTTLDQFRKENQISSVAQPLEPPAEQNCPTQSTLPDVSKIEAVDKTEEPQEELKKVSFIKFSQEEVLVIQPPKPSNRDSKELEVGIEVKPKSTGANVAQSIKLAKDKVLIGVQDGRGVLQINEGVPKRSFQMVIEEGIDGKQSVKLSLKEENPEDHPKLEEDRTNEVKSRGSGDIFPETNKCNSNESARTMMNDDTNTMKNQSHHANVRYYKSVESQVSWACLKDINKQASETEKYKSESTQYQTIPSSDQTPRHCMCCATGMKPQAAVADVLNECPHASQDTVNMPCRMPYLVHTLHEPRSLHNSSAYFASENPSVHFSIGRALNSRKLSMIKRQVNKPKSFSIGSDYSSSSKCTKIFRNIEEIEGKRTREEVRPLGRKDTSMTTSQDFEKILQNMCGSSYLYHHPELPESDPRGTKHVEDVQKSTNNSSESLLFDQWTQTDSCNQEVPDCVPITKSRILNRKISREREPGDSPHSRILRKKARRTRSVTSKRAEASSVSTSCLDDVSSSDSSGSKNQLDVFSMLTASDDDQLASTGSGLVSGNWLTAKPKSFIGQKIFAAIGDRGKKSGLSCVEKSCNETSRTHAANIVSVVNLALYDPSGPHLTKIIEENTEEVERMNENIASKVEAMNEPIAEVEARNGPIREVEEMKEPIAIPPCFSMTKPHELGYKQNLDGTHEAGIRPWVPSYPIRIKSKSCQNLSSTQSRSLANARKGITSTWSPIKKLRYPHLTATNSTSAMNVCGILNLSEGEMKSDGQKSLWIEKPNPRLDHSLPSAIRSLLLPKQPPLEFYNPDQISTYFCDRSATIDAADTISGMYNRNGDDWCAPYEAYDSVSQLATRRSLFKRTSSAMRTVRAVVTRKFYNLFRKLSVHSYRNRKDFAISDSAVYVAIPLQKKRETLQLYPRSQL